MTTNQQIEVSGFINYHNWVDDGLEPYISIIDNQYFDEYIVNNTEIGRKLHDYKNFKVKVTGEIIGKDRDHNFIIDVKAFETILTTNNKHTVL